MEYEIVSSSDTVSKCFISLQDRIVERQFTNYVPMTESSECTRTSFRSSKSLCIQRDSSMIQHSLENMAGTRVGVKLTDLADIK